MKRKTKGKKQVRIAEDLVDWLDEHATANKDGLTSRALVAEEAIRRYRDSVRLQGIGLSR